MPYLAFGVNTAAETSREGEEGAKNTLFATCKYLISDAVRSTPGVWMRVGEVRGRIDGEGVLEYLQDL